MTGNNEDASLNAIKLINSQVDRIMFIPDLIADVLASKPFLKAEYLKRVPNIKPRPTDVSSSCDFCNERGHKRYSCAFELEVLEQCTSISDYIEACTMVQAFSADLDPLDTNFVNRFPNIPSEFDSRFSDC